MPTRSLVGGGNSNYFDGKDGVSGDYTDTDFTTSMPDYVVTGCGMTKASDSQPNFVYNRESKRKRPER